MKSSASPSPEHFQAETSMVKLCRDCRHCDLVSVVAPKCEHPNAEALPGVDLVDGRTEHAVLRRCALVRASPMACAIEGRWFEAKGGRPDVPVAESAGTARPFAA